MNTKMRFGCLSVVARHKRAYLGKENPFVNHRAEIRPVSPIKPLYPLRLATSGREMAGLVRGGQGDFSAQRGFMLPILLMVHHARSLPTFLQWYPTR